MYWYTYLTFTNEDATPKVMEVDVASGDVQKIIDLYTAVHSGDNWTVKQEDHYY